MSSRYFEEAKHAEVYSQFRPPPPSSLISRMLNFLQEKYSGSLTCGIDVGCGSGQSTIPLGLHFTNVIGLDISEAQINEAIRVNSKANVSYKVSPAEILPFENESIQLVTAGQASHWFDLPKFYKEVERVLVPNGVLAMYCYQLPRPVWKDKGDELQHILISIYKNMKKYFGAEVRLTDNNYEDKEFNIPLGEYCREKNFIYESKATVRELTGFVASWSGFQNYKIEKGDAAAQLLLDNFTNNIMKVIGEDKKPEEIELTLQYSSFAVLGRKSLSSCGSGSSQSLSS